MESDVFINSSLEINGKSYNVKLTEDFITWDANSNHAVSIGPTGDFVWRKERNCIKLREVISVTVEEDGGKESREGVEMITYSASAFSIYVLKRLPKYRWKEKKISFHCHDVNVCQMWIAKLQEILDSRDFHRPKRLLVFVNPYGGKKKGPRIYTEKVAPLFELAGITTDVVVTKRANHAKDLLQDYDLTKIDGIVAVGGDGMFAEILNGLVIRWNRDRSIDVNDPDYELIPPDLRVGIIPAGSTDTVVHCTVGVNDPVTSALHIIIGDDVSIDVTAVHHDNRLLRYCVSMLGYGFYGDVLKDSEAHRWMGPKRYDWSGFKKFLKHKTYVGEVSFLAEPDTELPHNDPRDGSQCLFGCTVCRTASELQLMALASSDPVRKRNSSSAKSSTPSISEEPRWQKVQGQFIGINSVTISCRTSMSPDGFSPSCHLGDGHTDLVLVRECSRLNYFKHMVRFVKQTEDQFDFDFVQVFRVREFKFRPTYDEDQFENSPRSTGHHKLRSQPADYSVWNCDGEVIDQPAIDVRVHCQLIKLFARGIESGDLLDDTCSTSCVSCSKK